MTKTRLVNGQILVQLEQKLQAALEQKRLNKRDRMQYEILQLIVMFIADDHPKTREMYAVYRPMAWAMLVIAGAFLTALATGKVSFVIGGG